MTAHTNISRRAWIGQVAGITATVALANDLGAMAPRGFESRLVKTLLTPDQALKELMDGNARFVEGDLANRNRDMARIRQVAPKQEPFAAILGCSDSRVPLELVFDQGFGDLFPVRVAGNIVAPEIVASLEYGCAALGTSVLMVLGHSNCGAVSATMKGDAVPGQISALFQRIAPAVDEAKGDIQVAVERNVRNQAHLLTHSPVLNDLVKIGKLKIVGGVYDLQTGRVRLLNIE